jgi:peptidoglycan/xylan/chitin deacetylase (PgdA/CDA1 family)
MLVLLGALILALAPFRTPTTHAASIVPGKDATTTTALNLRTGPGTGYGIILLIPSGSRVFVDSGPHNTVWYKVTYSGKTGYVHGNYLSQSSAPPSGGSVRIGAYSVTTTSLSLRTGPSTSYTVKLMIPSGGRVFVTSGPHNSVWYQVTYNGNDGYVHGSYLKQGVATTLTKLPTSSKVVALTFDAGADVGYTKQILDTLAANGVKASFGMTGHWAETNPDLMRRIASEGHTIINHTYTHRSFTGRSTNSGALSYQTRADELWKTESAIVRLTNTSTKPYFRPPYGDYDNSVLLDVYSRGYSYNVMWTVDSLGWKGLSKSEIVQRCLNGLQPGAIYLFHVGAQSQDGPALQTLINELRARGYGFATIDQYYR